MGGGEGPLDLTVHCFKSFHLLVCHCYFSWVDRSLLIGLFFWPDSHDEPKSYSVMAVRNAFDSKTFNIFK